MPTLPSDQTTFFAIAGIDIPLYSSRGINQTLEPIDGASNPRRTINGELIDLSPSQFKGKYKSTVSGNDVSPPAFDGVYVGAIVTVDCAKELGYVTSGGAPRKMVVEGSQRVDGIFTFYRPEIVFMITGLSENFYEWQSGHEWRMELIEV